MSGAIGLGDRWADAGLSPHRIKGAIGVCAPAPAVFAGSLDVTSGLISYSIYLYHLAFIVKLSDLGWLHDLGWVAVAGVAFVCSVVEAAISYRLIEAPGIALGRRWAKAASARIARRRIAA